MGLADTLGGELAADTSAISSSSSVAQFDAVVEESSRLPCLSPSLSGLYGLVFSSTDSRICWATFVSALSSSTVLTVLGYL